MIICSKIAAVSAASSAAINVVSNRVSTGSWKGSAKAAVDGVADGFMWGGIAAGATFTTVAAKGIKIKEIGKITGVNAKKRIQGRKISKQNWRI